MIERIVKDYQTELFEPVEEIRKKLDHYRKISSNGIGKLSKKDQDGLKTDIDKFFNLTVAFFADTYPTRLFRITNNKFLCNGNLHKLQKLSQLVGPPADKSKYNRCNLPGESIFYAALDLRTAIWETQPQINDYITVSEWRVKDGQRLNAHSIFHPELTNLNKESQKAFNEYVEAKKAISQNMGDAFHEILKFFTEEFMKPVSSETPEEYHFSSFLSSRLLQTEPDENGFRIDAISYPSVKMEYGLTNLAILNSLVWEKLDLVSITLLSVAETNYGKGDLSADDIIKVSPLQYKVTDFDFEKDKILYNSSEELKLTMELVKKGLLK